MVDARFHTVSPPKTLKQLSKICGAELSIEAENYKINSVAPLSSAGKNEISFLDNIKYKDFFLTTKAGACIISPKMKEFAPAGCHLLISDNPYKAYALIAQAFYPEFFPDPSISDKAVIGEKTKIGNGTCIEPGAIIGVGVEIGEGCWIEPNAVIGRNVKIGNKVRVGANSTVTHAIIGDGVRIYPGVRIGQDGFGFAIDPSGHVKVPQLGRVMIGDHVEIGANTCIDRGSGPDTVIGAGTWIDNSVQIGHNVIIGKGCVIVAQVGISGSTTLEDYVVIAGQAGLAGHLTIGKGTRIGAQSGVIKDAAAGSELIGSPAIAFKDFWKQVAVLKKLTKPQ
jgi:UDP-3-O-[3-hydroxymyristoyl] glucosamine N-acyltransferase